jgi:tetratricopeptide (TPR) repeat protein
MARKLTFRQLVLSILALWNDLSQKVIAARAGLRQGQVSEYLARERKREMDDEVYERLLAAITTRRAAVPIVEGCLEALDALDREGDLSEEERGEIERAVGEATRMVRDELTEVARRSRTARLDEGYPHAVDLPVCRFWAEGQLRKLKQTPLRSRYAVVRWANEYRNWALCERCCEESVRQASRGVRQAAAWARVAVEIAQGVPGPESWRSRVRGYALAFQANALRVRGALVDADSVFEEAKRFWQAGADPASVLDPGRLLDLEGSLRRDQRRFEEALALFDQALAVGRQPERYLIKKGFTLEVMGEYERAIETLLQAEPYVESRGDSRLLYMHRFNLAVNHSHLGCFSQASELLREVRELASGRGDAVEMIRVLWLEGRILAGLGRNREARRLLSESRRRFEAEGMSYDAALALLEETVLLLGEGRTGDVRSLAGELNQVFQSKAVHREALAALRLFEEAAQREEASSELTRRVLRYLFRARYDQGLRFES